MSKTLQAGILVLLTIIVVLVISATSNNTSTPTILGNFGGDAANGTTTDQFGAVVVGGTKLLKTGPGVLEHVIITAETAGSFNLYDATSTNHGDHATTTLTKIYANLAEGSYDYQIAFSRGLLVEFQSTNVASSTITWK